MANPYEDNDAGMDPFKERTPIRSPTQRYTDPNVSPIDRPPAPNFFEDSKPQFVDNHGSGAESNQTYNASSNGAPPQPQPTHRAWSIEFYQDYFNVTTRQVLTRMSNALVPLSPPDYLMDRNWHYNESPGVLNNVHPGVLEEPGVNLSEKPDMYGPIWLSTTLWIILVIVQNTILKRKYHQSDTSGKSWHYQFSDVPTACILVYVYCFLLSGTLWAVLKWKNLNVHLVSVVCLYGYSLFIYVLVAIFCFTPWNTMRWIAVSLGGALSSSYLVLNLWHITQASLERQWFIGVVSAISLCHMLFGLLIKIIFL